MRNELKKVHVYELSYLWVLWKRSVSVVSRVRTVELMHILELSLWEFVHRVRGRQLFWLELVRAVVWLALFCAR